MAKKRTTVKSGPSRRPKKNSRITCSQIEEDYHEKLRKAFGKIGDHKGRLSEDRFYQIFKSVFQKPLWFAGIRRASRHEDFNEGTDFFIKTNNFGEIRFDVKSSFFEYEKQKEAQEELPIFVWAIVITRKMSDEEIRRAVFSKCEIHIARLKREVRLGHFIARTA